MKGTVRTLATALVALALPATFIAQEGASDRGGEKILVEPRIRGTRVFKGEDAESSTTASAGVDLAVGEAAWRYLSAGSFDADGNARPDDLCMSSCGAVPGTEEKRAALKKKQLDAAPHLWWFEVRPLRSEIGKVSFEIAWEHFFSDIQGYPVKVAGDTRRITMKEGDANVLDFVKIDPTPETYCYRNLVVEVIAKVQEDPVFAKERLRYDLWFEHRDARGKRTYRKTTLEGMQGEEREFAFEPLRFPVPGVVLKDGSGVDSIIEIHGAVRGRLRPDGSIDLLVGMGRSIGGEISGQPKRGGIGDGGHKVVNLRPGEAVSLVLPSQGEVFPNARVGVQTPDGRTVWIEDKTFYAGTQDSLIVKVTRGVESR